MPTLDEGTRVEQHDFGSTKDTKVLSMDDAVDGNVFRRVRGVNSLNKVTGASVEHDTLTADHIQVGSLTADLIDVEELSAVASDLGEIVAGIARDADNNFRIDFDDGVISIRDEQDPQELRLRIGALGAGIEDYGIEVWGPDGTLILGADGLGVAVVGENNLGSDCVSSDKVQDVAIQTVHLDAFAVTASKIGTLDGNGLQINLHATGSDAVLLHDNFRLDADGDAVFDGTVESETFTGANAAFTGNVGVDGSLFLNASPGSLQPPFVEAGAGATTRLQPNTSFIGAQWIFANGESSVDSFIPSALDIDGNTEVTGNLHVTGNLTVDGSSPGGGGVNEPSIQIEDSNGTVHELEVTDGRITNYFTTP